MVSATTGSSRNVTGSSRGVKRRESDKATVTHSDPASLRRAELSAFLRSRRERITPGQAGMPIGGRRRTPGLRREEVAQLAGVGVTWYTWLEQGRDIKVSDQVLDAIARTLLLDRDERSHLYTLAGSATAPDLTESDVVSESSKRLLEQIEPFPACIQNAKYDLLAYNRTYARLIGDMDSQPAENRNCMWLAFTDPAWRKALVDWEVVTARMVAQLRAHMAEHVAEPAWKAHIRRLKNASPEFAQLWERHDVAAMQTKQKKFRNPLVGMVRFDVQISWLAPRQGTRMLIYTPADCQTRNRLADLAALISQEQAASA
ncbi:MAG TPA: helix-turn-helix transcriptional regulator [Jatrophihabitans sp.]|jgi:transcriptional regulator with XRE-family HTH domain